MTESRVTKNHSNTKKYVIFTFQGMQVADTKTSWSCALYEAQDISKGRAV